MAIFDWLVDIDSCERRISEYEDKLAACYSRRSDALAAGDTTKVEANQYFIDLYTRMLAEYRAVLVRLQAG